MPAFIHSALRGHQSLRNGLPAKHPLPAGRRAAPAKQIVLQLLDIENVEQLVQAVTADSAKKLSFAMMGILKEHVPDVILELSGINPDMRCGSLGVEDKKKIAATLKDFRMQPGRPRGFGEAVAAAGGVDVSQINPATMESKIVRGLYITGELLDIDGDSGGYNLQFAWSTGAIAGRAQ